MPYFRTTANNLEVGKEYTLTHIGYESRTEGATAEVINVPQYKSYDPARPAPMKKAAVWKRPDEVIVPPTSKGTLEKAFRAWNTFTKLNDHTKDVFIRSRGKSMTKAIVESDYLRKAFFAGLNKAGKPVFTQVRSFGSKKPVAFIPVDVDAVKTEYYGTERMYHPYDLTLWAVWSDSKNNNTKRNNTKFGLERIRNIPQLKAAYAPNSNEWLALNKEEKNLIQKHLGGWNRHTRRN